MKVSELFEAAKPLGRNPKGYPTGGMDNWLKAFGAEQGDVDAARERIELSPEYKKLLTTGLQDRTTEKERKNGTIHFAGRLFPNDLSRHYKVLAYGKIDTEHDKRPGNYNQLVMRSVMKSPKPAIIPTDPSGSIVKSQKQAMSALLDTVKRVMDKRSGISQKKATSADGTMSDSLIKRCIDEIYERTRIKMTVKQFNEMMKGREKFAKALIAFNAPEDTADRERLLDALADYLLDLRWPSAGLSQPHFSNFIRKMYDAALKKGIKVVGYKPDESK